MDPFDAFSNFPTHRLTPQTRLALVDPDIEAAGRAILALRELAMVNFAAYVQPTSEEIRSVLQAAASGPEPAGSLVQGIPEPRRAHVLRGLAWLVKLGKMKVIAATASGPEPRSGGSPLSEALIEKR